MEHVAEDAPDNAPPRATVTQYDECELSEKNRKLLEFLDEYYATPDDMGEEWWDDFRKWLSEHRLNLSRNET